MGGSKVLERILSFRVFAWLGPAFLICASIQWGVYPLFEKMTVHNKEIQELEKNTYQSSWIDSVKQQHQQEFEKITNEYSLMKSRKIHRVDSLKFSDEIRQLHGMYGLKVIRIQEKQERASLLLKKVVSVDGVGSYLDVMSFLQGLYKSHPNYYLERLVLKPGKKNLKFLFSISKYRDEKLLRKGQRS